MAASEGVDLEWAIVEIAGKRKLSRKYSSRIMDQAEASAKHITSKLGKKFDIYHSDEKIPGIGRGISANPEPKTDIVMMTGAKKYWASVKMEGGIQLASGEGRSTAELFRAAAAQSNSKNTKNLAKLIADIESLPTRMLSESNKERILEENNPKLIKEFLSRGRIIGDKSYDEWVENNKPEIMGDLIKFLNTNKEFYDALIMEALTGRETLKSYKGAVANSIVSPGGFYMIDNGYVQRVKSKIKFDIRAKSRGGITSIAFRIETRGSL